MVDLPEPDGPSTATTSRRVSSCTPASTVPRLRVDSTCSVADRLEQGSDFGVGQPPGAAWLEVAKLDRADRGPDQPAHGEAGRLHHPPDDVVAPFVQDELDQRLLAERVDHAELVDAGRTVLEFDAGLELASERAGHRTGDLRAVRLANLVRGMHQLVGERAVVGQQQQ